MFYAFLCLPDRIVIDPIPPTVAAKYCFTDRLQQMPQSAGVVRWSEDLPATEYRFEDELVLGLDGKPVHEANLVLPDLPSREIVIDRLIYRRMCSPKKKRGRPRKIVA